MLRVSQPRAAVAAGTNLCVNLPQDPDGSFGIKTAPSGCSGPVETRGERILPLGIPLSAHISVLPL
jgi:hypothetical protein